MTPLETPAQWHWEQDTSLRFLPVAPSPGVAGLVCAALQGKHWADIPARNMARADWRQHERLLYAHEPFFHLELELDLHGPDGDPLWISLSGVPVRDAAGGFRGYRGVGRDISRQRHTEATLASLALNDQLTGLANRRLLLERLHSARLASSRSLEAGALLCVDIDNFKGLNHALGHAQADALLREVARRLLASTRAYDTVARLGADGFVVLATALGQDSAVAARNAQTVAYKMAAALALPFLAGARQLALSCHLGICLFQGAEASVEDIVKRAEMALRQAKQDGRQNPGSGAVTRYFDPQIEAQVNHRSQMERALAEALGAQQLRLHYQPIVNLQCKVIGYEVLLRWMHPELGLLGPHHFIALAEQSGLIVPIGEWVLEQACLQLAAFQKNPAQSLLTVAVNLSARQLAQPGLVTSIERLLQASGAPATRLKLEITESMLLTDMHKTSEKLHALTRLGLRFSLDDFGTGYSSLSYLKKLPLSQLKIDQSFVRELLTDPVDAAIVKTILQLARSLGLSVIAEGVELEGQRIALADMGCREFQGYLFGKPGPLE